MAAFLSYPPIWASLTLSEIHHNSSQISNPESPSESYAKEINRRLALYLERSGGHPLRLDIFLWSNHNKAFTTIALEILLACSHRWQTAELNLLCDWPLDSILLCKGKLPTLERLEISTFLLRKHDWCMFEVAPRLTHAYVRPWAKNYGWILPWTQLTELILILDGGSIIETGDVLNLLPMLHNIKEFCLRFTDTDFEGGFPQFAPTQLNQLRVLEVSHPPILSWFEIPSLCDLYFLDYQQDYDEPLDIHGQIFSLIQGSGCKIRKLSFESGRKFRIGTLTEWKNL